VDLKFFLGVGGGSCGAVYICPLVCLKKRIYWRPGVYMLHQPPTEELLSLGSRNGRGAAVTVATAVAAAAAAVGYHCPCHHSHCHHYHLHHASALIWDNHTVNISQRGREQTQGQQATHATELGSAPDQELTPLSCFDSGAASSLLPSDF